MHLYYLGPKGTFSYLAAKQFESHEQYDFIPLSNLHEVIQDLKDFTDSMFSGHFEYTAHILDIAVGRVISIPLECVHVGDEDEEERTVYAFFRIPDAHFLSNPVHRLGSDYFGVENHIDRAGRLTDCKICFKVKAFKLL